MIHRSPRPDVAIADADIASYVLEGAGGAGGRPVLIDGPSGRAVSGEQLERSVRGLASGLARRGIGKGDVVALQMPNLPEYASVFHGVCAAGATNTTANPLYMAGELSHQLCDSGARLLVTVPPFLEVARQAAEASPVEEVFVVGEADATPLEALLGDPTVAPEVDIDPAEDLAVLPYSSGTTGLPKGVMLTHRNLVANLCQVHQVLGASERDVLIAVLPFFHSYGQTVLMNLGLRTGATIVTMPRFELGQFLGLIERHRVTRAYVVPPIALALAKHPAVDDADLSSLELIQSGAAPLGAELADAVAERVGCPVMQGYGLTETSPVTHMVAPDDTAGRGGLIGPPLANTECRVVDPQSGADVGVGERGELWIRGPQVMKGYIRNPEATAATIDEEGWLHTGDVAVVDADGQFAIVDRLKELIKYKGFQVPPAELEALLLTHPLVADAAVIGVPDEEAGELPKAFVVAGEEISDGEIMDFVAERVSPQKRIRLVERIEEVPKSPSGKILRRALAAR